MERSREGLLECSIALVALHLDRFVEQVATLEVIQTKSNRLTC
jgi:hypothetical protein